MNQSISVIIMKLKTTLLISLIVIVTFLSKSCLNTDKKANKESEGEKLLASSCYTCHSPTAKPEDLLAPPMIAVKKFYKKSYSDKDEFINAIMEFVHEPTAEKALMHTAVQRFGMMEAMGFEEEELRKIATYIYEEEIRKPDWFDDHYKEMLKNGKGRHKKMKEKSPLAIGNEMALKTKAALGKNLMQAVNERGVAGAVEFCNVQAIPITDSLATMHHASIKRVSDKNRNPGNKANEKELAYIQHAKNELAQKGEIKPQIVEENGKWVGYYPILTDAACMKCHGDKDNINKEALAKIETLYPEDHATGYKENELRGIWVIEMEK